MYVYKKALELIMCGIHLYGTSLKLSKSISHYQIIIANYKTVLYVQIRSVFFSLIYCDGTFYFFSLIYFPRTYIRKG